MLKNHTYKVGMYHTSRRWDRNKQRILYKLPYYPDRIIQWAIMLQLEPTFNRVLLPFVSASLPHRGIHYASNLIDKYMHKDQEGTKYYLKLDIKKFYPSINRKILKKLLRKVIKDRDLLYELDNIIDSFDHTDIEHLNLSEEERQIYCRPGYGLPVGSYLSQYLANFYLSYFDHWLKEECKCQYIIRYMDDIVIFDNSKIFLHNLLCAIKIYLMVELDLEVKTNYAIRPIILGLDVVGYKHYYNYKLLRTNTFHRAIKSFKNYITTQEPAIHQKQSCISILGWLIWSNSYRFVICYAAQLEGGNTFVKKYKKYHPYTRR